MGSSQPHRVPPSSFFSGHLRGAGDAFDGLVGKSRPMRQAVQKARQLCKGRSPVLLQGETGVGKELFARAIHESGCGGGAFVAVNCGGLPRDLLASELLGYVGGAFTGARPGGMVGKIEAAHRGTLFLDEIGEMPLDLQPYLLRVLEGGEIYPLGSVTARAVQFRLIAACNRDLRDEVSAGRFRADVFYRVSVTSLLIPALRDRSEDIPALVAHFSGIVVEHQQVPLRQFAPEVLTAFDGYSWPGNLRELRNVVEAMMLLGEGDVIGADALPPPLADARIRPLSPPEERRHAGLQGVERDAIGAAIRTCRGNLMRAASDLRISKSTLYLKLKKYGLETILDEARSARPRKPRSS